MLGKSSSPGKAYTPSYATDVKATIRREQKRERRRQKDGQEARQRKVKPWTKVTHDRSPSVHLADPGWFDCPGVSRVDCVDDLAPASPNGVAE